MASYPGEHPSTGNGSRIEVGLARGPLWLCSDQRLVEWASEGDERAFAAIFRRYGQELHRFALGIVGDPDDAQDALQATMVKALRALPGERREIQLKPWLYRIAHNESVELLRRRHVADELEPDLPSAAAQPPERVEQRTRLRALLDDLEDLPERQRGALVMRELSGLDFEAIAGALQASPAVVRQALYEARTSLRQMEDGREMACESVTLALSEGDGRVSRRRDLRAHLRGCSSCRRFREEMREREADFAAIAAVPAVASTALLGGMAGGKVATGGGLSGQFAGVLGSSVVAKAAITAAVVATVGVGVAQKEGLVDLGLPGGGSADRSQRESSLGGAPVPGAIPGTTGAAPTAAKAGGSERKSGAGDRPADPADPGRAAFTAPGAPAAATVEAPKSVPGHDATEPGDAATGSPPAAAGEHAVPVPQSGKPAAPPAKPNPGSQSQSQPPPAAEQGLQTAPKPEAKPAGGPPAEPGEPTAGPPASVPDKSPPTPPQAGAGAGRSADAPGIVGGEPPGRP